MGALPRVDTAIIGGSGLYALAGLADTRQISVYTPFGPPSDLLRIGSMGGKQVVVPGWLNWLMAVSVRFVPRSLTTRIGYWLMKK